jgi:hypothetical protein
MRRALWRLESSVVVFRRDPDLTRTAPTFESLGPSCGTPFSSDTKSIDTTKLVAVVSQLQCSSLDPTLISVPTVVENEVEPNHLDILGHIICSTTVNKGL